MKKTHIYMLACSSLFAGLIIGSLIALFFYEPKIKTVTVVSTNTVTVTEKVFVPKTVCVEVVKEVDRIPELMLSDEDKILIAKLVQAEAGNQDYIGKRLVVDVVLNRYNNEIFPNTIAGVIYAPGQFTHPAGVYSDECWAAVEAECMERLDYEIMYFRAGHFFSGRPQAYQHGGHFFSYQ